jgi:hypothetical protein
MSYTFIPLREYPEAGIVMPDHGKPRAAEYLTPAQAKALARKKAAAR